MTTEADALAFSEKAWKPIPRIARTIPFGYKIDPDNEDVLLPIEFELEALEKAKQHLRQFSYREVARWLSNITGRSISHMGLKKRVEIDRQRKRKATALKDVARRLEETKAKIERYERNRLGASEDSAETS